MLNRMPFNFNNYQCMNMIIKTENGGQLWLGDYTAAMDHKLLKKKQIKNVLTAAAMLNVFYPKDMEIKHKILHAFDTPTYKMTPHFNQAHQFIKQGLKNGNVLVHCAAGISRSTTCVLVYLMKEHCLTFKDALMMTRSQRPIVCPNHGFQSQLSKLDIFLMKKGHYKKNKNDILQKLYEQQKKINENQKQQENSLKQFTNQYQKTANLSKRFRSLAPNNLLLKTSNNNNSKNKKQTISQKKVQDKSKVGYQTKNNLKNNLKPKSDKDIQLIGNNLLALRLQVPKISILKK